MTARNSTSRDQRGAALLLIMLAILTAAAAVLVSRLGLTEVRSRRIVATQSALAVARQALIDYATIQPDMILGQPSMLPCPDIDDSSGLLEGEAHTVSCSASGITVMGRFPWRAVGVAPPRDASSSCLWYVVSGSWKNAAADTAEMINLDSNGQLQLWGVESANVIEGAVAADRPVAMIIAPMEPVAGQTRAAATNRQCSPSFAAAQFLDTDSGSGISNAVLSAAPDAIDMLAAVAGNQDDHNDRIATVTRADIEAAVAGRPDFEASMRDLGLAASECIADYARRNGGGPNDRRMPWPAPLTLADYRVDNAYDDLGPGVLSGRLPDLVDDSNALTGNPTGQLLANCDTVAVPQWSAGMRDLWSHWKDHFYYVVGESYAPDAAVPSACTNCLTVNGVGQFTAVVLFGNSRLDTLAQVRDAPPTDADTRDDIQNYLEAANVGGFPYAGGGLDLVSQPASSTFNDILFCIDSALAVTEC